MARAEHSHEITAKMLECKHALTRCADPPMPSRDEHVRLRVKDQS